MRTTHSSTQSRLARTLIALVISGCFGGTGSGFMGISGGDGGGSSGSPSSLGFFVQPSTTDVGRTMSPAVEVVARDSLGSTDSTFTGVITVTLTSNSTGASLSGTTAVRARDGISSFTSLAVDKAGSYTLQASASGVAAITSGVFSITTTTP